MRGTILGVHDGRGILLGVNDQRLEFPLSEWRSAGSPVAGQIVDYLEDGGQARAVFAVPGAVGGAPASSSMILAGIGVGCLALGFIIPIVPTIIAFVLGVIAAAQARADREETPLLLARIAWIGALVMLGLGILVVLGVIALFGVLGLAGIWSLGPMDF
ncbi:MAG TPA: hypothetical protein VFO00_03665 [Vitreimonas sp.]|nr:hypothetical protein [Vitreimonas sp.]